MAHRGVAVVAGLWAVRRTSLPSRGDSGHCAGLGELAAARPPWPGAPPPSHPRPARPVYNLVYRSRLPTCP